MKPTPLGDRICGNLVPSHLDTAERNLRPWVETDISVQSKFLPPIPMTVISRNYIAVPSLPVGARNPGFVVVCAVARERLIGVILKMYLLVRSQRPSRKLTERSCVYESQV